MVTTTPVPVLQPGGPGAVEPVAATPPALTGVSGGETIVPAVNVGSGHTARGGGDPAVATRMGTALIAQFRGALTVAKGAVTPRGTPAGADVAEVSDLGLTGVDPTTITAVVIPQPADVVIFNLVPPFLTVFLTWASTVVVISDTSGSRSTMRSGRPVAGVGGGTVGAKYECVLAVYKVGLFVLPSDNSVPVIGTVGPVVPDPVAVPTWPAITMAGITLVLILSVTGGH